MGWRFRKRIKIFRGLWINIGKKGVTGISTGKRGFTTTWNFKKGTTTTATVLPGLSYVHKWDQHKSNGGGGQKSTNPKLPPPLPPAKAKRLGDEPAWKISSDEWRELAKELNEKPLRSRRLEILQAMLRNRQAMALFCEQHGYNPQIFKEAVEAWEGFIRDHLKLDEEWKQQEAERKAERKAQDERAKRFAEATIGHPELINEELIAEANEIVTDGDGLGYLICRLNNTIKMFSPHAGELNDPTVLDRLKAKLEELTKRKALAKLLDKPVTEAPASKPRQ